MCSRIPRPSARSRCCIAVIQLFLSFFFFSFTCPTTCTPHGDICARAFTSCGTAVGSKHSQASGSHQRLILKLTSEVNFLFDRGTLKRVDSTVQNKWFNILSLSKEGWLLPNSWFENWFLKSTSFYLLKSYAMQPQNWIILVELEWSHHPRAQMLFNPCLPRTGVPVQCFRLWLLINGMSPIMARVLGYCHTWMTGCSVPSPRSRNFRTH